VDWQNVKSGKKAVEGSGGGEAAPSAGKRRNTLDVTNFTTD
jgi:hypothetical protein